MVNLDWDRVGADDLFVIINSFVPVGESVQEVKIYRSDFGAKAIAIEKKSGPILLREDGTEIQFRSRQ